MSQIFATGRAASTPGGLVLVFDLDGTLIDTSRLAYSVNLNTAREYVKIPDIMNYRILNEILVPAAALRNSGKVSAILLLTNNGMPEYIAGVCEFISNYVKAKTGINKNGRFNDIRVSEDVTLPAISDYYFDYVMTLINKSREPNGNPNKSLTDVAYMMDTLGNEYGSIDNLARNTYMFDDLSTHIIKDELAKRALEDHYILVKSGTKGGYMAGNPDTSNYLPVVKRFHDLVYGLPSPSWENGNTTPTLGQMANYLNMNLGGETGGRKYLGGASIKRIRRSKYKKSRRYKHINMVSKRYSRRKRQRGGGQYCVKKVNGKTVDYVYCAAECSSDGACSQYS